MCCSVCCGVVLWCCVCGWVVHTQENEVSANEHAGGGDDPNHGTTESIDDESEHGRSDHGHEVGNGDEEGRGVRRKLLSGVLHDVAGHGIECQHADVEEHANQKNDP